MKETRGDRDSRIGLLMTEVVIGWDDRAELLDESKDGRSCRGSQSRVSCSETSIKHLRLGWDGESSQIVRLRRLE